MAHRIIAAVAVVGILACEMFAAWSRVRWLGAFYLVGAACMLAIGAWSKNRD